MSAEDRIDKALWIALAFGGYDGSHHKAWVIDQMVRMLTGEDYDKFVKEYEHPEEDDENYYEWDCVIAP